MRALPLFSKSCTSPGLYHDFCLSSRGELTLLEPFGKPLAPGDPGIEGQTPANVGKSQTVVPIVEMNLRRLFKKIRRIPIRKTLRNHFVDADKRLPVREPSGHLDAYELLEL